MPQVIETTVYKFEELSDSAKQRARDWWIQLLDSEDYADPVYEDFLQVCECLGIEVSTRPVQLVSGKRRQDPAIYWSGFSCQGDGACFEGQYRANTTAAGSIAAYAPLDEALLSIAQRLDAVSEKHPQVHMTWKHDGRYYHEYSLSYSDLSDWPEDMGDTVEIDEAVQEAVRDLCRWLYKQLEESYWDAVSDEAVDENIMCNEYTFTAEGKRFG